MTCDLSLRTRWVATPEANPACVDRTPTPPALELAELDRETIGEHGDGRSDIIVTDSDMAYVFAGPLRPKK